MGVSSPEESCTNACFGVLTVRVGHIIPVFFLSGVVFWEGGVSVEGSMVSGSAWGLLALEGWLHSGYVSGDLVDTYTVRGTLHYFFIFRRVRNVSACRAWNASCNESAKHVLVRSNMDVGGSWQSCCLPRVTVSDTACFFLFRGRRSFVPGGVGCDAAQPVDCEMVWPSYPT